ncbi:hypothetical protein B0H10DRAFT_1764449, partial [Mycena sp. CBHHK59/15]
HFRVRSDNDRVIGALAGGKVKNPEQNCVLARIVSLMCANSIWFSTDYVPSLQNLEGQPSRGIPTVNLPRSTASFPIPYCLKSLIHEL